MEIKANVKLISVMENICKEKYGKANLYVQILAYDIKDINKKRRK